MEGGGERERRGAAVRGAAGSRPRSFPTLPARLVELLLRVGHVVLRAVVDHRVDVRVLVVVLLVDLREGGGGGGGVGRRTAARGCPRGGPHVLEGVEEDAEPWRRGGREGEGGARRGGPPRREGEVARRAPVQ